MASASRMRCTSALKGFRRLYLAPGESKVIQFKLTKEDLSLVTETGQLTPAKGTISISVGGGQPGMKTRTSSNIVTTDLTIR